MAAFGRGGGGLGESKIIVTPLQLHRSDVIVTPLRSYRSSRRVGMGREGVRAVVASTAAAQLA